MPVITRLQMKKLKSECNDRMEDFESCIPFIQAHVNQMNDTQYLPKSLQLAVRNRIAKDLYDFLTSSVPVIIASEESKSFVSTTVSKAKDFIYDSEHYVSPETRQSCETYLDRIDTFTFKHLPYYTKKCGVCYTKKEFLKLSCCKQYICNDCNNRCNRCPYCRTNK